MISSKRVLYLAHPVGAPSLGEVHANLTRALRWLHWLVDNTPHAVCAPWIPYVAELPEDAYRDRGLRDDLIMLERCDAIVLVGGRVSAGMATERAHAHRRGLRICDLIAFGTEPPDRTTTPDAIDTLRVGLL